MRKALSWLDSRPWIPPAMFENAERARRREVEVSAGTRPWSEGDDERAGARRPGNDAPAPAAWTTAVSRVQHEPGAGERTSEAIRPCGCGLSRNCGERRRTFPVGGDDFDALRAACQLAPCRLVATIHRQHATDDCISASSASMQRARRAPLHPVGPRDSAARSATALR